MEARVSGMLSMSIHTLSYIAGGNIFMKLWQQIPEVIAQVKDEYWFVRWASDTNLCVVGHDKNISHG